MRLDKGRLQDDETIGILRRVIKEDVDWLWKRARCRLSSRQTKQGRCNGKRAELRAENDHSCVSHSCMTVRLPGVLSRYTLRPRKNPVRFTPALIMKAKSAPAIKNRQPRST